MRTRAKHARALLISSGLPRFMWEEAMNHSNWLRNRTPAHTNNGKTPYELRHKKKPNLAGIQEFGATAYVKDLKAGKLNARAKVGLFVGYDSESKGYRIYWPQKRSIMIEQNVVFNQDNIPNFNDSAVIQDEAQSEGKRQKITQAPLNNAEETDTPDNEEPDNQKTVERSSKPHLIVQPSNSVNFPSIQEPHIKLESETPDIDQSNESQYG